MFKIVQKNRILINRGDIGIISLTIPLKDGTNYAFSSGDIITFGVYTKSEYQNKPLIYKEITIEEEGQEKVEITLDSEDTKIGNIINSPVVYWYEIQLNYEQTILGYDKDGPKYFVLYPEGVGING